MLGLLSQPLWASEFIVAPRLSLLGGSVEMEGGGMNTNTDLKYELNFGVQLLMPMDQNLTPRVGVALGTVKADASEAKDVDRLALNGGMEYNFINNEAHRLYGLGDLIYNKLTHSNDDVENLNLNIGLGVGFNLAESVSLGGEVSTTVFPISKGSIGDIDVAYKFQELAFFVAMKLQ
jgi:hypothetical protein